MSRVILLFATALAFSGTSFAGSVYPLEPGWTWEYVAPDGRTAHASIDGTRLVQGTETIQRVQIVEITPGEDDLVQNYWTLAPGGEVLLHGFSAITAGFEISYDPPIQYLAPSLEVGSSWGTTTQAYSDLEGTQPLGDPFTVVFLVASAQELAVPAGTFFAYEVRQAEPPPPAVAVLGDLPVTGGPARTRGTSSDWLAGGVGLVRFEASGPWDLESYGAPVAVERFSWGGLKALYRSRR